MDGKTTPFRKLLDNRFGMFVHYGLYSAFEGYYKGEPIDGLGEWIQRNAQIPISEYEAYGRQHFCPSADFAKNLVKHAKEAGIRFIVLTSKHHDGFCLFESKASDYTSYEFYGRDICKELADECKKEGIDLGFYYSHTLDWYEKDGAGNYYSHTGGRANNRNFWDYPDDNIDFEKYLEEKCIPQVKELLTNYGELKIIWFDFPHDITKEQSKRLREVVKSIQPDCQINSRIAHNLNDYESLGDNALPVAPVGVNIECLVTLNDTWGYKRDDHNWKSADDTIGILCRTLSSDATLLLNVGPKADGTLTPETVDILNKMGEWTAKNGEAVYGRITGNPLPTMLSWGEIALKDNNLYLYVADRQRNEISLPGVLSKIKSVSLLGSDKDVTYEVIGKTLVINQEEKTEVFPVYKVEFEETPEFSSEIVQFEDMVSLGTLWAGKVKKGVENEKPQKLFYEQSTYIEDYGQHGLCLDKNTLTAFWTDTDEILCWDVYFENPGVYEAEIIHAVTCKDDEIAFGKYKITVGDKTNLVNMEEEKKNFRVSKSDVCNIRICRDGGVFNIEKAGKYRVLLSHDGEGDSIMFSTVNFVRSK